uniref:ATP-binding protein n=1 Tax=Candidatus Caldatribacterium saccharofermentans TaxID=1454753 RepID=A0A7V4TWW1_9BACT
MSLDLDSGVARRIIETVGTHGVPPEYGFQYFTAGLDPYLSVIEKEYLASFIREGGSAFKMVIGAYGGGKTHFLYCIRDLAWKHNFVVSYVRLSPTESPFHSLDRVYGAIVKGLTIPLSPEELLSGYERGIKSFLRSWFSIRQQDLKSKGFFGDDLHEEFLREIEQIEIVESLSFARAVKGALRCLLEGRSEGFECICQWLNGEPYDRKTHGHYGIFQRIDRTTAFSMIRSLVQWIRQVGYSGLVILLDEAEQTPSLSTRQKGEHLSNLREIIDECGHTGFQGVFILYAVPDENFLEGRTQVYEALRQRLGTVFNTLNPTGVKINLEELPLQGVELLMEIGENLKRIYELAYSCVLDSNISQDMVRRVAEAAYNQRFGDIGYKRLFVQKCIQALHFLREKGQPPSLAELQM